MMERALQRANLIGSAVTSPSSDVQHQNLRKKMKQKKKISHAEQKVLA